MKLLDARECARRPLQVLLYDLVDGKRFRARHSEALGWLRALGLPTSPDISVVTGTEPLAELVQSWAVKRQALPYEADGLVVKVDRFRRAAPAGCHRQVPALGHRLQVPGVAICRPACATSR